MAALHDTAAAIWGAVLVISARSWSTETSGQGDAQAQQQSYL